MKRLGAVVLTVGGVGLIVLGLLFLMAAAGRGYRFALALLCLTLGGGLTGLGVRLFKQAEAASPEQLRAELLELARRRSGEISEVEVMAELGRRGGAAVAVLAGLEAEGRCQRRSKDGGTFWVFKDLQPRLLVIRCEFCNAELSIAESVKQCPNCGGTLKSQIERRSLSDGEYRMDD